MSTTERPPIHALGDLVLPDNVVGMLAALTVQLGDEPIAIEARLELTLDPEGEAKQAQLTWRGRLCMEPAADPFARIPEATITGPLPGGWPRSSSTDRYQAIQELKDAIWSHVQVGAAETHWAWTGAMAKGEPVFRFHRGDKLVWMHARKAIWLLTYGPLLDGVSIGSECDVATCVNPFHLVRMRGGKNMTLPRPEVLVAPPIPREAPVVGAGNGRIHKLERPQALQPQALQPQAFRRDQPPFTGRGRGSHHKRGKHVAHR